MKILAEKPFRVISQLTDDPPKKEELLEALKTGKNAAGDYLIHRKGSWVSADPRSAGHEVAFSDWAVDIVIWLWVLSKLTPVSGQRIIVECLLEQPAEKTGTEEDGILFEIAGHENCPGAIHTYYNVKATGLPESLDCSFCHKGLGHANLDIDVSFSATLTLIEDQSCKQDTPSDTAPPGTQT